MFSNEKIIAGTAVFVLLACTTAGYFTNPHIQLVLDNTHWFVSNAACASLSWLSFKYAPKAQIYYKKWFFIATALYLVGGICWLFQVISGHNPFPALSDIFYLLLGPLLIVGFIQATKTQLSGAKVFAFGIDALSFTTAILGYVLVLYLPRTVNVSTLDLFVLTAYPVSMLSAACISLLLIPYLRPVFMLPWLLLSVGLFLDGATWMTWNLHTLNNTNDNNVLLNKLFSVSDVLVGLGIFGWTVNPSHNPAYLSLCRRVIKIVPLVGLGLSACTIGLIIVQSGQHPFAHYIAVASIIAILVFSSLRQSVLLDESEKLCVAQKLIDQKEREKVYLAQYDQLTGLPNRWSLQNQLERALIKASSDGLPIALFYMDINRFKSINESYGHHTGDLFMQEVANRFKSATVGAGTLGRMESDKFLCILEYDSSPSNISNVAQSISTAFSSSIVIDAHEFMTQACVGVSLYPQDAHNAIDLIRNANTAFNRAKVSNTQFTFYSKELTTQAKNKLNLDVNLRKAIENKELFLEFQPIFAFTNHRLTVQSLEALVRWKTSAGMIVPPDEFIPYAEEVGLIFPLGEWVIKEACSSIALINSQLVKPVGLSINISPKQFREPHLTSFIANTLEAFNIDPKLITLEITESAIFDHESEAIEMLYLLKNLGVKVSLDDFGVGHSSLFKLKSLPINELKVDKSFIVNAPQNEADTEVIRTIAHIAKILKLSLVVEGVETKAQYDFLKTIDCEKMQGFLLCKPANIDTILALIKKSEQAITDLAVL